MTLVLQEKMALFKMCRRFLLVLALGRVCFRFNLICLMFFGYDKKTVVRKLVMATGRSTIKGCSMRKNKPGRRDMGARRMTFLSIRFGYFWAKAETMIEPMECPIKIGFSI